jgi:hypothetical protein
MESQIEYRDNINEYLRELSRAGVAIQKAAALALNRGAGFIASTYKLSLKNNFTLRNKFTLGAIRVMKAHEMRSNKKDLRPLRDVNAKVGVDELKGGKLHYLAKHETGHVVRGIRKAKNRVPIPLRAARTAGSEKKPIAPKYRMLTANVEELKNLRGLNARQQYGAMRDLVKRGKVTPNNLYMTEHGIFDLFKKRFRVTQVRNTDEVKILLKGKPLFGKAVSALTEDIMAKLFVSAAKRLIKKQ